MARLGDTNGGVGMKHLIKQDYFIDDDIEITHEVFDAADTKLRESIKSRIGSYQWNRFIKFFDTQEDLHNTSVEGLTKGRPKSAVKDDSDSASGLPGARTASSP